VPTPPERNDRQNQADDEQDTAPEDEIGIRLPEVEEDGPRVERVERGEGVGLGRAAHKADELGRDARRVDTPERNAQGVCGRCGASDHESHRPRVRLADELERRGRPDHQQTDAELRLHQGRERAERPREQPASGSGGDEGAEEWQRPDRVDLPPVRSGEDRAGLERPERSGGDGGGAPGAPPQEARPEQRDADVCWDADRFDGEPKKFAVEERAEKPQDVQERGWVVAEIARFVEAPRADFGESLGPRLERADVGRTALRTYREETDE